MRGWRKYNISCVRWDRSLQLVNQSTLVNLSLLQVRFNRRSNWVAVPLPSVMVHMLRFRCIMTKEGGVHVYILLSRYEIYGLQANHFSVWRGQLANQIRLSCWFLGYFSRLLLSFIFFGGLPSTEYFSPPILLQRTHRTEFPRPSCG